jgi:LmbE family N-acetylglucosaminyl deacetylase
MVACRPKPMGVVNELYFCELPASTDWSFSQIQPAFSPNVYIDITDFMDAKKGALMLYSSEIYAFPDARSIGAVETLATYRGYQAGVQRAEAFQLVFFRETKSKTVSKSG